MARARKSRQSATKRSSKTARKTARKTTAKTARKNLIVTETRQITTEPKVELRKPATLAQALTEPELAVVKPETKTRLIRRTVRRSA
jgi:hypothetical protein